MQLQLKINRQFANVFVCVSNLLQQSHDNWKGVTVHDQSAHARNCLGGGYFEPLL
jgi:hypothetical protein